MKRSISLIVVISALVLTPTVNAGGRDSNPGGGFLDDTFCGGPGFAGEDLAPGAYDNVIVRDGLCRIDDGATIIVGNVKVEPGGGLVANGFFGPITIGGSVQCDGCAFVMLGRGVVVTGDVQVRGADGNLAPRRGTVSNVSSSVGGNVLFEENSARVFANGATIGGNLQIFRNTSGNRRSIVVASTVGGDLQLFNNTDRWLVTGNTVGGNLQCKDNAPAPTGSSNTVTGNKEDQCAAL